jgi:hypothetical protein
MRQISVMLFWRRRSSALHTRAPLAPQGTSVEAQAEIDTGPGN